MGSKGATKPRVKAFNYGNILTQAEYEAKLESSGKRLMTRSANSTATTPSVLETTNAVKWGLIALGLYKGYQFVRNRK